ncbi:MAG: RNA polymerase sigma factor [Actinomycetes bacterium]
MSTAPELPDPGLAPAWADGSEADVISLEDALRRAAPRLRRYATRRLNDSHEAEEVVQEALLRACQHTGGFATEDDLMAWSTVVTGRLVIDRLRQRTRSITVADVPEHTRLGRDTADVVVARDEARAALDALEAMPARQAAVLWSREVEGLSYDEIAARFELSEPTVRSLLHRARRTLRREYAARGGTLPVAGLAVLAPWRGGLHGLAKLRHAARQAVGPVAAGTAAMSILGVTTFFLGAGATHQPARPPRLLPSESTAATQTVRAAPPTVAHGATNGGPGGGGGGKVTGGPHRGNGPVITLITGHHCARDPRTGATSGQAGVNCHYNPTTPAVVVRVPLPNNPTGLDYVGLTSDKIDCRKLPRNRIARCVDQQQPSTSVSRPK